MPSYSTIHSMHLNNHNHVLSRLYISPHSHIGTPWAEVRTSSSNTNTPKLSIRCQAANSMGSDLLITLNECYWQCSIFPPSRARFHVCIYFPPNKFSCLKCTETKTKQRSHRPQPKMDTHKSQAIVYITKGELGIGGRRLVIHLMNRGKISRVIYTNQRNRWQRWPGLHWYEARYPL